MFTSGAAASSLDHAKLFEPDTLVPEQYYQTTRRTYYASPELRLMAAVLEDAVATLMTDQRRCSRRQQREFREALEWLNGPEDADWAFSFISVCESLDLEPTYLRQGLLHKIDEINHRRIPYAAERDRYVSPRRKLVRMRAG